MSESEIHIGGDVRGQIAAGTHVTQEMTTGPEEGGGAPDTRIVVLFCAANPLETDRLALDEEVRLVGRRLREGTFRDVLDLRQAWAVRVTDLPEALLRERPTVVHFSGHGSPDGRIVTAGDDGHAYPVPVDALAELLGVGVPPLRCVVLNTCHSLSLARAVADQVECVVGTTHDIGDTSAMHFAAGFYRGLGFGMSLGQAFALGRNEVRLLGGPADAVELVSKPGIDPTAVHLLPDRSESLDG